MISDDDGLVSGEPEAQIYLKLEFPTSYPPKLGKNLKVKINGHAIAIDGNDFGDWIIHSIVLANSNEIYSMLTGISL